MELADRIHGLRLLASSPFRWYVIGNLALLQSESAILLGLVSDCRQFLQFFLHRWPKDQAIVEPELLVILETLEPGEARLILRIAAHRPLARVPIGQLGKARHHVPAFAVDEALLFHAFRDEHLRA